MDTSKIPILNFFVGKKLKWITALSVDQVSKEIDSLPGHRLFGSGGQLVTAKLSGQKFSMRCDGFAGIGTTGNAFEHVGIGKIEATSNGSTITMYFRLRLHVFIFFAFWLTGALIGSFAVFIGSAYHILTGKGNWQNSESGMLFSIVFMSFAFLFPWFSRKLAAKNEIKIINSISEIVKSEPISYF